jgi:predicted AAA+ superfamily ATPase
MIPRTLAPVLEKLAGKYPVLTVTGPRQSGKTTLCRSVFPEKPYVNLESPDVREHARQDPRGFLSAYPEGAILDEIQRVPELLSYLQPIIDESGKSGRYVLTGSQQFGVMSGITQSLAGRTAILKLLPLSIEELSAAGAPPSINRLLFSGFYPRIFDAGLDPTQALGDYLETYVERDLRQLLAIKDLALFEKFIRLCAGRAGQLLNLQSLGNDVGVSHTTARSWLTLLEASYIVHLLPSWHANVSKRQIKAPKLYFHDVGLAAYLLGIENETHVDRHPLRGNLFENLVVMDALKYRYHRGRRSNLYFWRDARGNEVDLLIESGAEVGLVEIKAGATVVSDWVKPIDLLANKLPIPPSARALVYGGSEQQKRSYAEIWPYCDVSALMNQIESN